MDLSVGFPHFPTDYPHRDPTGVKVSSEKCRFNTYADLAVFNEE